VISTYMNVSKLEAMIKTSLTEKEHKNATSLIVLIIPH
jgi:hypothetical protein